MIKQPNKWSCLPTALAISTGLFLDDIFDELGHDGSDIKWPDLEEPFNRRGFSLSEIKLVAFKLGWSITTFKRVTFNKNIRAEDTPVISRISDRDFEELFAEKALLIQKGHALAWDGLKFWNPSTAKPFEVKKDDVEILYVLTQRK